MISTIDRAWLAAFWEGEGSVGCYKASRRYKKPPYIRRYLSASVAQNDIKILTWIQSIFGGSIYKVSTKCRCYRLAMHGETALKFLNSIRPFVKIDWRLKDLTDKIRLHEVFAVAIAKGRV